jgi:hypothetical protein
MTEPARRRSRLRAISIRILRILFFGLLFAVLIASFLSLMSLAFTYLMGNQISFYIGSTLVIPYYAMAFLPIPIIGFFLVCTMTGLFFALNGKESKSERAPSKTSNIELIDRSRDLGIV